METQFRLPWRASIALCGIMISIASAATLYAQEADKTEATTKASPTEDPSLKEKLEEIRAKYQLPAMWCGVFHVDGRSTMAVTGIRRWKDEALATLTDPIHLGSCTKAMTGALIGQLCSEGKLRLDMTLGEIFPTEIPQDSAWSSVTVQNLLQHESGLPANLDWWRLMKDRNDVVEAREAMLQAILKLRRPQKTKFLYSNTGYALLGHIIEKVESKSWEEAMRERIAKPLGMESLDFGPIVSLPGESKGAVPNGHTLIPSAGRIFTQLMGGKGQMDWQSHQIDNAPVMGPAGSAHARLYDWAKFTLAFADHNGNERLKISDDVWKKLLESKTKDGYAGGWIVSERSWAGGRIYTHNGSNTTWYCVVFTAPEKNLCYLAATNVFYDNAPKACDEAIVQAIEVKLK
jgi:CubicO group peptidase (beta-lactamase class C family)